MNFENDFESCRSILDGLSKKKFSSLEVTNYFLGKIGLSTKINAVATLNVDQVRAAAIDADRKRSLGDESKLLGLPLSIKDSISVKDLPWQSGSYAREHVVAQRDATTVARLRMAGAIFLCKSTTPEYTWSVETTSALHGTTLNPYDHSKTCGGSSGGEAALQALGASPAGLGSDGLNSIRVPSHYCGTAGLRPTSGVVPETGVWPTTRESGLLDISTIGPMAKHVNDLDLLLDVIQGQDAKDPFTHNLGDISRKIELNGLRVGYFESHPAAPASEDVKRAVTTAVTALAHLGSNIESIEPWPIQNSIEIAFSLMAPDGGERVRNDVAAAQGRHDPIFKALLEQLKSQTLSISQYLAAVANFKEMRAMIRASLNIYDVIILPVSSSTAPSHSASLANDKVGLDISGYSYCFALAIAGVPSVSVPIFMNNTGLPVGVQVVAQAHKDRQAIEIAYQIQNSLKSFFTPKSIERE